MQTNNRSYKEHCFVYVFPDEPVVHNYKTNETIVTSFLEAKFQEKTWICDRRIESGRSRRRPDLFLDMGSHIVIDENKQDEYDCACENQRLMEISQDLNQIITL